MSSKNSFKYDRLTPDNAAFLFVDHQTGLLPLVNDWSEVELKNNVTALAKLAKIYKKEGFILTKSLQVFLLANC